MSLSATCESVAQKRSLSSLLAGHVMKRPRQGDGQQLQEAAVQLLETQQNLSSLLREVGDLNPPASNSSVSGEAQQAASQKIPTLISGALMASELRRQAARLGVPVTALSVKTILERLKEITGTPAEEGDEGRRPVLTSSQRVKLGVLMEFSRDLLTQGALCPRLLWTGYRQEQEEPHLEVVQHLHRHSLLTLKEILESDEGVRWWLLPRVKALCCWAPPQEDDKKVQRQLLITVVGVLVETGFRWSDEPTAANKKTLLLSRSVLDDMLFWLLDSLDTTPQSTPAGAQLWSELYDASLCEAAVSPDALQNFFTHSLTQTLTYKPQLTVSDTVTLQNQWTFPKTSRLLTSLFRRLAVTSDVEQLLRRLQQVLETHEVNWKHVLCFLSTLLVYSCSTQGCLRELLAKLLTSAFESYDLENMITAFLLARQGALEGPAVFLSYSEWFKVSFGGASSCHANSKKSLVFLLKFLSDLVPFEPPHYLKVHILHPPYVPLKHRAILMEYVSLAKTRLADLKESVEEMSLYNDVSASGATQDQAVQDVEKAVTLFESTGRISATIMEASIFRRTYFLTRFLPALLKPRLLPGKPDARMSFIEALQKADKIPAAQHTAYAEACQKLRHGDGGSACGSSLDGPLQVLHLQLEELRQLVKASEAEMSAQLSRVAHTLCSIFPERPEDLTGRRVTQLPTDSPPSSPLHLKAVDMVLRVFCQCLLDASRTDPPNKQSDWASTSLCFLLSNTQLLSSLLHRLWHLLHHQGSSLEASHLLGLAALLVHLHVLVTSPVQLCPPSVPGLVSVSEALASALSCRTCGDMLFSVRVCVAAACYGMCRAESSSPDQPLSYVPSPIFKKLLYLLPRLMPECRRTPPAESAEEQSLWSSSMDGSSSWRRTALRLWRLPVFRQPAPECQVSPSVLQEVEWQGLSLGCVQLSVAEWLTWELQVSRSEDALSDSERLEYHQWACLDHFLSAAETSGGCEGNTRSLVAHLLQAVMEHQLRKPRPQSSDTCLSDILGRLQDLVLDEELGALYCSRPDAPHLSDFLFELVSQRLSDTESVGAELAVTVWNRVLLALPSVCFIKVVTLGGRTTLDCTALVKHINLHQRRVCAAGGGLSFPVTSHFLKGLLRAATRCGPAEFNRCWTQISLQCPLLLVSTVLWWERLSAAATCRRDGADLPEPLQLLSSAHHWACSVRTGKLLQPPPPPASAPPLLLAAALFTAWTAGDLSSALELLRPDTDSRHREVLVHLLFLAVSSYVSAWLRPQEWSPQPPLRLCSQVLARLAHWPDWLLLFTPDAASKAVALATPADVSRLLPWAFFR
ncbi:Fanconi anemia group A protein [Synchiropus splendidus]|uniref:Fanconi anemia group A protein n=1 Tax=Synchiropus splendidus TaxID=270530 RepID=UPI00237D6E4D|nr:Fanconi anemia group A protein [Synchiropus splendidus]